MIELTGALNAALATSQVAPAPDAAAALQVQSVLDFVFKGGVMMIPIGLCSLVALAVVVERLISLRRGTVIPGGFLPGLKKVLDAHPNDKAGALRYCERDGSPVSSVFAAGIKRLGAPIEVVEKHIQEAGQREVLKLRRFVRSLSVIAAVTPLMGLLGTIFGMIKAFQMVALSGEALGKAELLAEGIYEAMITTAAGLLVAIPVLICYHWISAKIERLVMDVDLMTVDFIEERLEQGVAGMGGAGGAGGTGGTDRAAAPTGPARPAPERAGPLPSGADVKVAGA